MIWDEVELPEGWKVGTIGDVAKVIGGGTPSTSVPGNFSDSDGHPWVTPSDLTGYSKKFIQRGRRFLTDQGLATSSAKYLPAGSVLFSTRAPIGYVAIAEVPVTTNQGFRSFVPTDAIDAEYLYYALKLLKPEAEQMASGTTFAELSGSNAARLPIAYPEQVDLQRRIVALLDFATDKAFDAGTRLASAKRSVESFRQTILAAACSGRLTADWRAANLDAPSVGHALAKLLATKKRRRPTTEQTVDIPMLELPEGYTVASLGDTALLIEYGTSQRSDSNFVGGIPILRMGNIQDGQLDVHDLKYCFPDNEIKRLLLEDGDLLFNRTNSPSTFR